MFTTWGFGKRDSNKCDGAGSHIDMNMREKCCVICGKSYYGAAQSKTCSDRCRQALSRRKRDAERQAIDIGKKLDLMMQGYNAGAIDHELARAIVGHIERRFDRLRVAVEAEQLQRLLEKHT